MAYGKPKLTAILASALLLLVLTCKQDPLDAVDRVVVYYRDPWPEHLWRESSCADLAERADVESVEITHDSDTKALVDAFRRLSPPLRYTSGLISTSICLTFYAADSSVILQMQIGWAAVTPDDTLTLWEMDPENNVRHPYLTVDSDMMRVDSQFLAEVMSHLPYDYLDGIQLDR